LIAARFVRNAIPPRAAPTFIAAHKRLHSTRLISYPLIRMIRLPFVLRRELLKHTVSTLSTESFDDLKHGVLCGATGTKNPAGAGFRWPFIFCDNHSHYCMALGVAVAHLFVAAGEPMGDFTYERQTSGEPT